MTKQEIREQMKQKRASLTPDYIREKSLKMTEDIIHDPDYVNANILYIYFPIRNEIDTNYLIVKALQDGKTVAVPVCISSNDMVFERIDSINSFHSNRYQIMEPSYNPTLVIDGPGLMVVPLVGFDGKRRIGYGKNYYNNYLKDRNYIHTIGVAYDFQDFTGTTEASQKDIPLTEIRTY